MPPSPVKPCLGERCGCTAPCLWHGRNLLQHQELGKKWIKPHAAQARFRQAYSDLWGSPAGKKQKRSASREWHDVCAVHDPAAVEDLARAVRVQISVQPVRLL